MPTRQRQRNRHDVLRTGGHRGSARGRSQSAITTDPTCYVKPVTDPSYFPLRRALFPCAMTTTDGRRDNSLTDAVAGVEYLAGVHQEVSNAISSEREGHPTPIRLSARRA